MRVARSLSFTPVSHRRVVTQGSAIPRCRAGTALQSGRTPRWRRPKIGGLLHSEEGQMPRTTRSWGWAAVAFGRESASLAERRAPLLETEKRA